MRVMYLGDQGTDVAALQGLLKRYDPTVTPDGRYGPKTERTDRLAQRRLGLFPPDGRAGPVTLSALAKAAQPTAPSFADRARSAMHKAEQVAATAEAEVASWWHALVAPAPPVPTALHHAVAPAIRRAMTNTPPPGEVRDPRTMSLSVAGRQFIFHHEAGTGKGVTRSFHHPSGGSGVTVGAGYDFGARSRSQIKADLMFIGVDAATAETASLGAGLRHAEADAFCRANKGLLNLSFVQQANLLGLDEARFEKWVKRIKVPLHQYEFDALTSFAGNNGGHWKKTVARVEAGDTAGAAAEMQKAVTSAHVRMQGLVNRRRDETRLYVHAEYRRV